MIFLFTEEKLDLVNAFKKLLPLAHEWKGIGTLLGIPDSVLKRIKSEEDLVNNRLQEVLGYWIKQVDPLPTWTDLANAVQPFDMHMASEIRKCIFTKSCN